MLQRQSGMFARLRPYILLFVALVILYNANLRPVDSGDTFTGSLIPFAVVLGHSVTLDRFAPWMLAHVWYAHTALHASHGHYFSSYPIGGPLLVSPFYAPLAWFVRNLDPASLVVVARIAQKAAASAVAALSAVLLLLLLRRITSAGWAWCLTGVYALGTETWAISSQAMWQHGPAELAIIGAFLCLDCWTERRGSPVLWICGVCTAAAFVFRPTSLVLVPAMIAALVLARASLGEYARFLAGPLAGGLVLAGYNWYVFDRMSGGYGVGALNGSFLGGLAGVFASPGRGLLIYTPVVLFALFAFSPRAEARRRAHGPLFNAAVIFAVLDSIAIARSVIWWGGYCWGPRLLTELAPAVVVLMGIGVSAFDRPGWRQAFAALAVYSVLMQAIGVFFYPSGHWDARPASVDSAPSRLWAWGDNPIVRAARAGIYWEPYAVAGAAITGGIPAARVRMRELNIDASEEAEPGKMPRAGRGLP